MRGISSFCVLLGLILIVTILPCFSADPNTLKEESSKYLDAVREFADNVLKYVINGFCCFDIRYTSPPFCFDCSPHVFCENRNGSKQNEAAERLKDNLHKKRRFWLHYGRFLI